MSGRDDRASLSERQKYVRAFNSTMIKIWREQIVMLGVIDTGALYRSVYALKMQADGKFLDVTFEQAFNIYGLYQDFGTGSNTFKGNGGDIGRANARRRRRWFSKKYFASVMNIQEFFADNVGRDFCRTVSNMLGSEMARSQAAP